MKKVLCIKYMNGLRPADESATQYFAKIADRELVSVQVSRPRNLQFLKKYWVLVSKVWDNLKDNKIVIAGIEQVRYPNTDALDGAIKISVGLRTRVQLPTGEIGFIPGSIAFHNMTEFEFSDFYDKVCDLIAEHFIPGVSVEALKEEIEAML